MKLSEFYAVADQVAPKAISDEFCTRLGWYDNSGVLVDCGEEIKGALFTLDLTNAAIDEALKVVMTHMHELNYGFYKGTTRHALIRAVCVDRDEVTPEEEAWLRTCHNNRPDTAVYPPLECDPTANGKG